MHLISTPFSTSYTSYTRRGRSVIYLQFPPYILVSNRWREKVMDMVHLDCWG